MALIPTPTALDIAKDNQQTAVKEILTAKYADAGSWMSYGATLLDGFMRDIETLLSSAASGADLTAVAAALAAIDLYTAPAGSFTYTSPLAPSYDPVGSYVEQTLGTILDIPPVEAITIADAPSTDVVFTNSAFTDTLLNDLRTKLLAGLTTGSTGLGDAEAGLFARETARQNDARAKAYNEVTTALSSRGFDMPPGALLAKQTEMNNESGLRLSDSSSQIMAESARLAVDYNKSILGNATQLLDLMSRVFDNQVVRDFEAAKTKVQYAVEGYKQVVAVALAKADLNKTAISATIQANQGTVEVFKAGIEGQVAPMKAIAETNQAKAQAFGAEVQAAAADLTAQMAPEELKLKGVVANAQIAGTKADIAIKEVALAIEDARRQVELEAHTLISLAGGAQQIIAAAGNGVSVSSSFGFSGTVASNYGVSNSTTDAYGKDDHKTNPTLPIITG